jgi:hypothetical protein
LYDQSVWDELYDEAIERAEESEKALKQKKCYMRCCPAYKCKNMTTKLEDCGHFVCKECTVQYIEDQYGNEEIDECPQCRDIICDNDCYNDSDNDSDDSDDDSDDSDDDSDNDSDESDDTVDVTDEEVILKRMRREVKGHKKCVKEYEDEKQFAKRQLQGYIQGLKSTNPFWRKRAEQKISETIKKVKEYEEEPFDFQEMETHKYVMQDYKERLNEIRRHAQVRKMSPMVVNRTKIPNVLTSNIMEFIGKKA